MLGDRYIDSSLAYQGAARSLGVDEIASLSAWATRGLYPSLTFLLDLPPEVGARRRTDAPDRMERESMDFHERVRHEYLRLADAEPERIVVIDAVGTVDEVFSEIRGVLVERFDGGSSTIDEAVDGSAGSVTAAGAGADAPAETPAESEDAAPEVASPEAPTEEAFLADAPEASAPDTADEETASDEAAPVLVDASATAATRKRRAAKALHKGSTEKRSSRKPATMVGALGESQGALWDE